MLCSKYPSPFLLRKGYSPIQSRASREKVVHRLNLDPPFDAKKGLRQKRDQSFPLDLESKMAKEQKRRDESWQKAFVKRKLTPWEQGSNEDDLGQISQVSSV